MIGWFCASIIYSFIKSNYSANILKEIKKEIYSSINRYEMSEYMGQSNEYYLNVLTKDIDIFQENYIGPSLEKAANAISAIVSILTIFVINWKLRISFTGISFLTIILSQLPGVIMAKKL